MTSQNVEKPSGNTFACWWLDWLVRLDCVIVKKNWPLDSGRDSNPNSLRRIGRVFLEDHGRLTVNFELFFLDCGWLRCLHDLFFWGLGNIHHFPSWMQCFWKVYVCEDVLYCFTYRYDTHLCIILYIFFSWLSFLQNIKAPTCSFTPHGLCWFLEHSGVSKICHLSNNAKLSFQSLKYTVTELLDVALWTCSYVVSWSFWYKG